MKILKIKLKSEKLSLIIIFCLISFVFSFFIETTKATQLYIEPSEASVSSNSISVVKILLTTETGEEINALDVNVEYSAELMRLKDWSDGNSIINLWLKKPENINGVFSFQGIIPGGYRGENGLLMTLYFENQNEGLAEIKINNDSKILLNDGNGTETEIFYNPGKVAIGASQKGSAIVEFTENDPPESFTPVVSQSDQIYGGGYFLIFSTQDKKSGINYYEISEGENPWEIAESPYLLRNQKLDEQIRVKAIDKAGNERIETLPAQNRKQEAKKSKSIGTDLLISFIFLLIVILSKYIYTRIRRKNKNI